MLSIDEVNKIFKDFVKQTCNDSLKLEFEDELVDYRISLNYIIEGKGNIKNELNPTINISNYQVFIEILTNLINKAYNYHFNDKDYMMLTEEGYRNFLLMGIICNMHEIDFNDPISYLKRIEKAYDTTYSINSKKEVGEFKIGE